jgi:peptide/nickel transport system permease protein
MDNNLKMKKNSKLKETWRRFKKNKLAIIGLIFISILILTAIFADVIVPLEKGIRQNAAIRLQPPSAEHIFGTDEYGRDVFARIIHGSRLSLTIGFATTLFSLIAGSLLGSIAGYYGGKVDNIIMRICDVFACIPPILLTLAIVAALGTSTINLFIAISIATIPSFIRIVRSLVLGVYGQEYIEAARSYGASDVRIILKYILPNIIGPIIVSTTMAIGGMILAAAALSFIGMGVQPPTPEWGSMLSNARGYIRNSSYLLVFPGVSIMLAALALNLIGDGLRDVLDPRLKS